MLSEFLGNHEKLIYIGFILFLAMVELRVLVMMHKNEALELAIASKGVIIGTPHWKAYQNRLLGPYLIEAISFLSGQSYLNAFWIYLAILTVVNDIILFLTYLILTGDDLLSVRYTIYSAFSYIALQDYWWYPWDPIDVSIFTLLILAIYKNLDIKYFIILFIVELLNREVAIFIGIWLVIDSFDFSGENLKDKLLRKVDKVKIIIGITLTGFCVFYTTIIRDILYKHSMLAFTEAQKIIDARGNHFDLFNNLRFLLSIKNFTSMRLDICIILFIFSIFIYLFLNFYGVSQRTFKINLLLACIMAATLVFGFVKETRIYFILIPIIFILILDFGNKIRVH